MFRENEYLKIKYSFKRKKKSFNLIFMINE